MYLFSRLCFHLRSRRLRLAQERRVSTGSRPLEDQTDWLAVLPVHTVRTRRCRCLRLLFAFLFRVSLCSDDNKMNTENLGIVFAPNLLRVPNSPERSVLDLQARNQGLQEIVCVTRVGV